MYIDGFIIWLDWIFYAHGYLLVPYSIATILVAYHWLHILESKEVLPWTVCMWVFYCYIHYGYGVG